MPLSPYHFAPGVWLSGRPCPLERRCRARTSFMEAPLLKERHFDQKRSTPQPSNSRVPPGHSTSFSFWWGRSAVDLEWVPSIRIGRKSKNKTQSTPTQLHGGASILQYNIPAVLNSSSRRRLSQDLSRTSKIPNSHCPHEIPGCTEERTVPATAS